LHGLFDEITAVNNLDHGLQSSSALVVVELSMLKVRRRAKCKPAPAISEVNWYTDLTDV